MKRNLRLLTQYALLLTALLFAALFPIALNGLKASPDMRARDMGNNPDHFFLWATNSTYSYTFIYDPLMADNWLRESGGFKRNEEFVDLLMNPR